MKLSDVIDPIRNTVKTMLPTTPIQLGIEHGRKVLTVGPIGEEGIGKISRVVDRIKMQMLDNPRAAVYYDGDTKSIKIETGS